MASYFRICQENSMKIEKENGGRRTGRCIPQQDCTNRAGFPVNIKSGTKAIKIGTWNVRTMNHGKLNLVKAEMDRIGVDLLGVSELKWTEAGHFQSSDHWICYSGNETYRRNGVAFILNRRLSNTIMEYNAISDRVISIRLRGSPINTTLIQVYAPTTDAEDEELDKFYYQVQEEIDRTSKQDLLILMGDLNAKVGKEKFLNTVGSYGLGETNEAGERFREFCSTNQLAVLNTFFQNHKRRLYTWTSPNGLYKNQIDYICVRQRWRSSASAVKTKPGADCGSDHELLSCKIRIKLRSSRKQQAMRRIDLTEIPQEFWGNLRNRFSVLDMEGKEPEELWMDIKKTVHNEIAESKMLRRKKKYPQHWITPGTLKLVEERRAMKAKGEKTNANKLSNKIRRALCADKEEYYQKICSEIEQEHVRGKARLAFMKIKEIKRKFQPSKGMLKDARGKKLTEPEEIKRRWKEHTEQLYRISSTVEEVQITSNSESEPDILEDEVLAAIKLISKNKAPGCDNIPLELIQPSEAMVQAITKLCQRIWETGKWPIDWTRSVLVPIHKKGDTADCSNYRTIALIPHASKILLKILQGRLLPYVERELPEEQAGFRRGRGAREITANIRWIMEKAKEYQQNLYLCFIDYSKAFDCVSHQKLWKTLKEMGVPTHLINLIRSLYEVQEATVRTEYGDTEWFKVERGVRQGCILSPFLFNLYAEMIFRNADIKDREEGIRIGGQRINNLRYADDTTLIANSSQGMKNLIRLIKRESQKMGLLLNMSKTKILTTENCSETTFDVDGDKIEMVNEYNLLGSMICAEAKPAREISRRIAMGKATMKSLDKVFKSKNISIPTKLRLVQSLVFSVVTYGCESWTMRKQDRRRINVFEMWCWRRILAVRWTDRRTNNSILEQIQPTISLEAIITKLQLAYFGHIIRRQQSLEKDIMIGRTEGIRRRGRPAMRWMDAITTVTGKKLAELNQLAQDRSSYRSFIHRIAKVQNGTDGR